ncbi:MAG: multicopper oxidase domain-containing protein [Chloroflexi bacterium]|nr:multicopper oxidase domain-containing protein [Chloroflexota bacterium]
MRNFLLVASLALLALLVAACAPSPTPTGIPTPEETPQVEASPTTESGPIITEPVISEEEGQTVVEYTLEIVARDIDYGSGAVWHAWTFNGTVPAPTLRVKAGEILRVRVINHLDLIHSFHTHLTNYAFEMDGSQANVITGQGAGAMIPPGGEYVYEFQPTTPGIYYYHCHSADGGFHINQHILQGLYGAIIVEDPDEPPMREEVVFMAEMGHNTEGNVPAFIMNGLGLPGGEATLERIFGESGFEGVAEQLGVTVPFFQLKVNEPIKLHVINIGNLEHSMHIHSATHVSLGVLGGRPWPANLLPLVSGAADTLLVNFSQPGLWLFHCHVVSHADAGMIGVFIVEE